jgi:hypothetical protein
VRDFKAKEYHGTLFLQWRPPRGSLVSFYRVERTREGRKYQTVAETQVRTAWCLRDAPVNDPWFYRVTAVNSRGAGAFKIVWFFQRNEHSWSYLRCILAVPGLHVNICE